MRWLHINAAGLDVEISRIDPESLSNLAIGRPHLGEVYFRLTFDDLEGSWYPWLFPTSIQVADAARDAGFEVSVIGRGSRGTFLAEVKRPGHELIAES